MVTTANKLSRGDRFYFRYAPYDSTFSTYTVKSVRKLHSGRVVRVDYVDENNTGGYCELPSQEPVFINR